MGSEHAGLATDTSRCTREGMFWRERAGRLPCDELYRGVVESAPDSILVHDLDGSLLDVNETACRTLGFKRDELLAMSVSDFEVGLSAGFMQEVWERAWCGESLTVEGCVRKKDGSTIPVEVRFSRLRRGRQTLLIAFVRDIGDRKRAEVALRASEARNRQLAAIVEASEDGICSLDPSMNEITYWNSGAERMWGWSREEAVGKPDSITIPADRREELRAVKELLKSGEGLKPYERVGIHKDGSRLDVSVSLFPVLDKEGRIISYAAIQRDVTELRRAREEGARRKAEYEQAMELNRLKDHFLSTISHELKTPLSLVSGFVELLEDLGPTDELIEGIKDGTRRLREHVEHLIDYSALVTGSLPLYRTEISMADMARNVAAIVEGALKGKNLEMALEIAPDVPVILGDPRRITQLHLELLENAEKFTPPGGRIGMRVSSWHDHVKVDVWDTGPGIPEADLTRIWQAFTQLEVGNAFRKGGLGLGLSIVKRLVELHEGWVEITSRAGEGTTFSVYLPAEGA